MARSAAHALVSRLPLRLRRRVVDLYHSLVDCSIPPEAFLRSVYRRLLGREIDEDGLRAWLWKLSQGLSRTEIVLGIAESEEYATRRFRVTAHSHLPDLTMLRPDRYELVRDRQGRDVLTFFAKEATDVDWLEQQILQHGYYEGEGVWALSIDLDKRVMAEIVSTFAPRRVLDLGCSTGAVLACLDKLGVNGDGIDLSCFAHDRAFPAVRDHILVGDLLKLELPSSYDLVMGLDIFEHFNPRHLSEYIATAVRHLDDGGFLFTNIPAFGNDPIFGTAFETDLQEWNEDIYEGRPFRRFQVDEKGFPLNGHLIWAPSTWWVKRFEEQGLSRLEGIERALHEKYDSYMRAATPARLSYYVFGKEVVPESAREIEQRVRTEESLALRGFTSFMSFVSSRHCQEPLDGR